MHARTGGFPPLGPIKGKGIRKEKTSIDFIGTTKTLVEQMALEL